HGGRGEVPRARDSESRAEKMEFQLRADTTVRHSDTTQQGFGDKTRGGVKSQRQRKKRSRERSSAPGQRRRRRFEF
ncbi:hypothetical protein PIB30_088604, partial [Stylosanthes scabra]|nr:hypothetical protein [Stylosanthes scabra]